MKIHEIEKDIKIPISNSMMYPILAEMEIGESCLITPTNNESIQEIRWRINSATHHYNKKTKKQIVSRTMKKENGIRIWRIE